MSAWARTPKAVSSIIPGPAEATTCARDSAANTAHPGCSWGSLPPAEPIRMTASRSLSFKSGIASPPISSRSAPFGIIVAPLRTPRVGPNRPSDPKRAGTTRYGKSLRDWKVLPSSGHADAERDPVQVAVRPSPLPPECLIDQLSDQREVAQLLWRQQLYVKQRGDHRGRVPPI